MKPRHSIIIITYKREQVLRESLEHLHNALSQGGADPADYEVVLVDNDTDGREKGDLLHGFEQHTYLRMQDNLGVSGGRNAGIRAAKGQWLIFIDDDAFVHPEGFLALIDQAFDTNPAVGILAFKSINYYSKTVQPYEFPHTDKTRDPDQPFKTFRYIGVAHAIRREVFDQIGLYHEDFFYGMEEFDLSYAAIKRGIEILYFPEVWVVHKKSPQGRLSNARVARNSFVNKLKIAHKHLPWRYYLSVGFLWAAASMIRGRLRVNLPGALLDFLRWRRENRGLRQPMTPAQIRYVRQCGGALWK